MVVCDWNAALLVVLFLLLLLSENVYPNPGPVKFLCIICCKPVKSNQDGMECSSCSSWCHRTCDGMSKEEYIALFISDDDWFCCHCESRSAHLGHSTLSLAEYTVDSSVTVSCSDDTVLSAPTNSIRSISCVYFNFRSVVNKLVDLASLFSVCTLMFWPLQKPF